MSTEMAQMNTRISRSLKERGDAALEKAGMTPSQAVRKLWDFAKPRKSAREGGPSLSKARISLPTRTNERGSSLRSGRRTRRTPRCASTP